MCAKHELSCPEIFAQLSKQERLAAIQMLIQGLHDVGDFEVFVNLIDEYLTNTDTGNFPDEYLTNKVTRNFPEIIVKEECDDLTEEKYTIQATSRTTQCEINMDYSSGDPNVKIKMLHSCELCDKQFTLLKSLRRHFVRFHSGQKKTFKCDLCGKEWTRKADLDAHTAVAHKGDKSLTCTLCHKSFSRIHHLKNHERMHTGELYSCEKCDKQFTTEFNKTAHMRIFHEESEVIKPFSCDICQKRWISKSDLEMHRRTHTGEKPYTCTECNKSFSRLHRLNVHKRIHDGEERVKPYPCLHCPKLFADNGNLKRHLKTHTGEKPHSCDICGRAFTQNGDLKRHIDVVHLEIKPFSCDKCGCLFGKKLNLNRHNLKCS